MTGFHLRHIEPPEAVLQLPEPSAPVWWRCDDARGLDVDLGVHYATDATQLPDRIYSWPVRHFLRAGDEWLALTEQTSGAGRITYNIEGVIEISADRPPAIGEWQRTLTPLAAQL